MSVVGIVSGVLVAYGGLGTVVGCGSPGGEYPSRTAKDWIAHADHVAVVTATAERDGDRREMAEGQVSAEIQRVVTFTVDDVLWSAGRPRHALGEDFAMVAAGWSEYRKSGRRVARTTGAAPRLESGHTYLLALRWAAGRWVVLGEGASVPFDDRTAGLGEWCGRVLSAEDVARGERFSRLDDNSLEEVILGKDERAVVRELEEAAREAPSPS
ncbi:MULTISPECIES: hypothetical protein [unclassified Streptomyces]|uniref:hypothetical protein n=1 Tax=unclassified Streptomyces TaxID=2593676 RepID=UPI0033339151